MLTDAAGPSTPWTLTFDERRCVGCGECVGSCPEVALGGLRFVAGQPKIVVDWDRCTHCLLCLPWCPTAAYGRVKSPN
ncbi:MAG TPA: 4Fe-4S dicluster domain-containing protein [Acidimicrobiia bacterium]|nr:4Fe-4S dicluster domain-containing protein [Acidimicrobiia bacterium]